MPPEQPDTVNLTLSDPTGYDGGPVLPDVLPILPLRGIVVYPHTTVPLTIGQPRSLKLIEDVASGDRMLGLVTAKNPELETPGPNEIYAVGTLATVHRLFRAPDGTIRLLVQGIERIRVENYTATEPYLQAHIYLHPENAEKSLEVEALMRNAVELFSQLTDLAPSVPPEMVATAMNLEDPLELAYTLSLYVRIDLDDSQKLLEIDSADTKLRYLLNILRKELEVLELGRQIQTEAQSEIEKLQREYFLREQLKAIQRELGEGDEQTVEVEEFSKRIEAAQMPPEAEREARRELDRLGRLPTAAAEYGVIRTYLDWLTSIPWNQTTPDNLDVTHARSVLDQDHYGLDDVKERILEYLAVRKLRAERAEDLEAETDDAHTDYIRLDREGVILCFVGPPGVGKTSLGISIARAMGRKFTRMSLGGVRDEAEIRGFRRTYIGAMPGRIVQTLRRVESKNPVIMLDEVDKIGSDFRGDPASALLEVLDPEQNREFRDHYLDVPVDLSQVMFITTANLLDPIQPPLRDRMEIINLPGYTEHEKIQIAQQYLVARQIRENGLRAGEVDFADESLRHIIRDYTREAGVRHLEQQIGRVCRKVATRIAEGQTVQCVAVDVGTAADLLGRAPFSYQTELRTRTGRPGVATGLAWTPTGGEVLFVEATAMPGSRRFEFTGQLGEVMQESARAAYSYLRAEAADLGIEPSFFEKHDIHLHVPAGAVPKDGPSAGVAMVTALASLLLKRPTHSNVAMTGELTLRGQVLPVGGIKAKVLAAHRLGIDTVIMPKRNAPDLEDLPDEVRTSMTFVFAEYVEDVLGAALEPLDETPASPDAPADSTPD
jgi:ATP-dependent Lon protease